MFNSTNLQRRVSVDLTSTFSNTANSNNRPYFVWCGVLSFASFLLSTIGVGLYHTRVNEKHSITWHFNTLSDVLILLVSLIIRNKLLNKANFAKLMISTSTMYQNTANADTNADSNSDDNTDSDNVNTNNNLEALNPSKYINYMPFAMLASMVGSFMIDLSFYFGIFLYGINGFCLLKAFSGIVRLWPRSLKERIIYGICYFTLLSMIIAIIATHWNILTFILFSVYLFLLFTLQALTVVNVMYYSDTKYRKYSFSLLHCVGFILFIISVLLIVFNIDYFSNETNESTDGSIGVLFSYILYKCAQLCIHNAVLVLNGVWRSDNSSQDVVAVKSLISDAS